MADGADGRGGEGRTVSVFARAPQQSDYAASWTAFKESEKPQDSHPRGVRSLVSRFLPVALRDALFYEGLSTLMGPVDPLRYRRIRRRASWNNPTMYTRVTPMLAHPIVRPSSARLWALLRRAR